MPHHMAQLVIEKTMRLLLPREEYHEESLALESRLLPLRHLVQRLHLIVEPNLDFGRYIRLHCGAGACIQVNLLGNKAGKYFTVVLTIHTLLHLQKGSSLSVEHKLMHDLLLATI